MKDITIITVSTEPSFHKSIRSLVENEGDIVAVDSAIDCGSGLKKSQELAPDVLIIDDDAVLDGPKLAQDIRKACLATAVIVLSSSKDANCMFSYIGAFVEGYILKGTTRDDIAQTVRVIHNGQAVYNYDLFISKFQETDWHRHKREGIPPLHKRELEVICLAAKGYSNVAIGQELGINEHTVGSHLTNIYRKLDVSSRTEAVLRVIELGLPFPQK